MNNNLMFFSKNELESIREWYSKNNKKHCGYIYLIECDDYVKIGSTNQPIERISALIHMIQDYCSRKVLGIALSKPHTNYRENELLIHEEFSNYRLENTELFRVSVEEIEKYVNKNMIFEDKSLNIENKIEGKMDKLKMLFDNNKNPDEINLFSKLSNDEIDFCIFLIEQYVEARNELRNFLMNIRN